MTDGSSTFLVRLQFKELKTWVFSRKVIAHLLCAMAERTLNYEPRWYHIGDADETGTALAYGILALGTIFLIEYIFSSLLFSGVDGISLSDAAANITFRNSSWIEIVQWISRLVSQPERQVCKRAIIAIILRFIVFAIDIGILYLSVPRSIDVLESDVGSSRITFPRITASENRTVGLPCKPDPIKYSGFKPNMNREICHSITSISNPVGNIFRSALNQSNAQDFDFYGFYIPRTLLVGIDVRSEVMFYYTHTMRSSESLYYLWPTLGTLTAAIDAIVLSPLFPGCLSRIFTNAVDGSLGAILCPRRNDPQLFSSPLHLLFNSMGATPIFNRTFSDLNGNSVDPVIGVIDRPRLCILPALILFLSLFAVALMIRFKKGKLDLSFKQWILVIRQTGNMEEDNPFFSDRNEIVNWNLGSVTEPPVPNENGNV